MQGIYEQNRLFVPHFICIQSMCAVINEHGSILNLHKIDPVYLVAAHAADYSRDDAGMDFTLKGNCGKIMSRL